MSKNPQKLPKFTVLFAVNGSGVAEKAFEFYMDNFYRAGATDIVVSFEVAQPVLPPVAFSSSSTFPANEITKIVHDCNIVKEEVEKLFIDKCKKYKATGFKVIAEVTKEKPGTAIIKRAEVVKANLIVVGSEVLGKNGTTIASVSNFVLLHATVPVLIFRFK